ncbi:MAG: hypothetical protein AAF570_10155 [Bacteroidota bacterium]
MDINPIELPGETSNITSEFFEIREGYILVAKFTGDFGRGSDGWKDKMRMLSRLLPVYFLLEPVILVLDLTGVNYEMSNSMMDVVNFMKRFGRTDEEREAPFYIAVNAESRPHFESLVKLMSEKPIFFDNADAAISEAISEIID